MTDRTIPFSGNPLNREALRRRDPKWVEAHHDDYFKPLDVRWLCFRHHRELHGQTIL